MKKNIITHKRLLVLAILLSCWALLSIQLEIIPTILTNWSQDFCSKLNHLYINLTYSFIAGFIFYILTSWLPKKQDCQRLEPVLKHKIGEIKKCISDILLEFSRDTGLSDYTSRENCEIIMMSKVWTDDIPMFILLYRWHSSYISLVHNALKTMQKRIYSFIQTYKDYLSSEQIVALEELTGMQIIKTVSLLHNIQKLNLEDGNGKKSLVNDFCDLVDKMNEVETLFNK